MQRKRRQCDADGKRSKQLYLESEFTDGFTGSGQSDVNDGLYGNGTKCSGLYGEYVVYVKCDTHAYGKYKSFKFYDMCGTECDADGKRSGELYVVSGSVDRDAGSGKSWFYHHIHIGRSERKLHGQYDGYGSSKSCSGFKSSGEPESCVQR